MDNSVFFENVLIKFIFTDNDVRERVLPFLTYKIFDKSENIIISKQMFEFIENYDKFPTVSDMKLGLKQNEVLNHFLEIIKTDVTEYKHEFLIQEIETFIRNKIVANIATDILVNLTNEEYDKIKLTPDQLREAIAFSFDTKVGLDLLEEVERLYNALHNKDRIIPTGLTQLDEIIGGGLHEKSLLLFLAETNMGKSLIRSSMAVDTILKNKNVLYISCEMSEEKIAERVAANILDICMDDLKLITKDKFKEKFDILKKQISTKFIVKEYPPSSINVNHIRNLVKELKVKKGFVPDVIFIDYIGIMVPAYRNKGDNTYLEVKRISEEVRAVAVELGIPIVSAVQTNRGGFGSAEIDLTNISDSIGTAATADIIIGVTQSEEYRALGKYKWIILKNRYGINKKCLNVNVDYYKMRVYNSEDEVTDTADSLTKDPPPSDSKKEKIKKENVSNAVSEVKGVFQKDIDKKKNKLIDVEI